jgi:hypothetical protein
MWQNTDTFSNNNANISENINFTNKTIDLNNNNNNKIQTTLYQQQQQKHQDSTTTTNVNDIGTQAVAIQSGRLKFLFLKC